MDGFRSSSVELALLVCAIRTVIAGESATFSGLRVGLDDAVAIAS